MCYSDWSHNLLTEESEWLLPLATTTHKSRLSFVCYICVACGELIKNIRQCGKNFGTSCPPQFLSCDAFGVCVRVFCDFGDEFVVSDPTGEEPKEIFIQNITQVNWILSELSSFSPLRWHFDAPSILLLQFLMLFLKVLMGIYILHFKSDLWFGNMLSAVWCKFFPILTIILEQSWGGNLHGQPTSWPADWPECCIQRG